jgi:UDP-N-acetylglucosamine:LPS N-acetylglucosamine transferase
MSRRVLILSADIGEGHATAAKALAGALRERGAHVEVVEDLRSLGRFHRHLLVDGSRLLFAIAPRAFDAYYRALLNLRPVRALSASSLVRFGSRPLLREIRRHRPDVIVSTYPGTTVVLGSLRRRGRLDVPTVATITDLAGLFFWAARGIDLHLVAWRESIDEVLTVAPDSPVRAVAPLTNRAFFDERRREEAREALGLPTEGPVVLVSGGGWGVGDVCGAVDAAADIEDATVVCLAGRNERLHAELTERFGALPHVRVLGFTDRMPDLLAAADALIHGTGGVTCSEAALRGCPVVLYGFSIGHVRHNAEVMEGLGMVTRAGSREEVGEVLRRVLAAPCPPPAPESVDAAELVLDARPLPAAVPSRRAPARRLAGAAGTVGAVGAMLSTGAGYSLAAHGLDLGPLNHVTTRAPVVGLVLDGPRPGSPAIAQVLRRDGASASVAVPAGRRRPPAHARVVDVIPKLPSGQLVRWVRTAGLLARHTTYLVPARFTLGQYLLAYRKGAHPVAARVRVSTPAQLAGRTVHRGDVLELDSSSPAAVAGVVAQLRARGLRAVCVPALRRSA